MMLLLHHSAIPLLIFAKIFLKIYILSNKILYTLVNTMFEVYEYIMNLM